MEEVEVGDGGRDPEADIDEAEAVYKDDDPLLGGFQLVLTDEPTGHCQDEKLAYAIKYGYHGPACHL